MGAILLLISLVLKLTLFANEVDANCRYGTIDTTISDGDKHTIVKKHNALRIEIANHAKEVDDQPRGVNLKRFKWDNYLATEAQKIAETCEFAHKGVHDNRFSVGQNLYMTMSSGGEKGQNWNDAIQGWFDEHKSYTFSNSVYNHYTQVVWATTEYVGCGFAHFKSDGKWKYKKIYVCNYGPAGNVVGSYPYKTGNSGCENLC